MARRYNIRCIKANRSYTIEEAAEALQVSQQTIRTWVKEGLPILRSKKPYLILGSELQAFLQDREARAKSPTAKNEFFCLRCRAPHKPFGMMVDCFAIVGERVRLEALCEACEGKCSRFTTRAKLPELYEIFDIAEGPS